MNVKISFAFVSACLVAATVPVANASVQDGHAGFDNWQRCDALRAVLIPAAAIGLPSGGARVTHAALVPAGGGRYEGQRDATLRFTELQVDELNPYGEYCLVKAEILPAKPSDQATIFYLALPSRWNGKSLQVGWAADHNNPPAVDPRRSLIGISAPAPIARGYAVYSREWRSEEPLFQNNEPTKKTHDVAMELIGKYYGRAARYRYYSGAGTNGYEGLTLIQRYPEDYEGILTQCPVYSITGALHQQVIHRATELNGATGAITPDKAAFLRRQLLADCDQLDGLKDGIISNVEACRFDFAKLRCPGGRDSGAECFSDAQLETLRTLHRRTKLSYTLASGETHLPAYPVGADWDAPLRSAAATKRFSKAAEGRTRDFFLGGDPQADVMAFDPLKPSKKVLARIQEASRLFDRSAPNIDGFIAHGGKWIVTHGWADDRAPATSSIEHYNNLIGRYGQTKIDQVMRLYLIPGYGHGSGVAFNGNGAPNLEALEDWVERGVAPGTLTVVDTNPGAHGRSRPMCSYPSWPRYIGAGDPDLASSFSCVADEDGAAVEKRVSSSIER